MEKLALSTALVIAAIVLTLGLRTDPDIYATASLGDGRAVIIDKATGRACITRYNEPAQEWFCDVVIRAVTP